MSDGGTSGLCSWWLGDGVDVTSSCFLLESLSLSSLSMQSFRHSIVWKKGTTKISLLTPPTSKYICTQNRYVQLCDIEDQLTI